MTEPVAYRAGDRQDFERLYVSSYGRLLGTLVGVLGDRAAAEDCLQEAFEKAFRAWPGWKPTAPAEAWLHRIAINVAVSYQRRQRLREAGELVRRLGRPTPPPDPADAAAAGDLTAALRRLPAKQSAAIVLRHYHGYSNREIAVALGIPERTVASRLAAAKMRLRHLLRESAAEREIGTATPWRVPSSD
jgi:RNA polymerase sigma-70 factor (ECF subfamily)